MTHKILLITITVLLIITFALKFVNVSKEKVDFKMSHIELSTGEVIELKEVEAIEPTIWKGSIDGVLFYKDGSSVEIDVSSHGNFFGIKGEERRLFSDGVLYHYNFSDNK